MSDRYFEDYQQGAEFELGTVTVTEAEIVEFAKKYDPQPFHVDAAAAAEGPYGGLIASGWHTGSLMMSKLVGGFLSPSSSLGSPGLEELKWIKPVRPGDELSIRATVLETRPSKSKPDRGLLRSLIEVRNQDGETVTSVTALNFVLRR